ncbi:MAG: phage terminase large subunit [Alphaproteobacteria bacterium]|nr:phage terminase large subunit [Alphaproteobacteria bacterium]
MESSFYQQTFPATRLSNEKTAVSEFETTARGCRLATSIGGMLTGRGADFIIIDDPLKPDEASSDSIRQGVNDWHDNTLSSRFNDQRTGCEILIMQRLHEDDLVGHVLAQGGWTQLSFPAIAELDEEHVVDTPLGPKRFVRRTGEALHPERQSLEWLRAEQRKIGESTFAGQYQQSPAPKGGGVIKRDWFKMCPPHPIPAQFGRVIQSWDTASMTSDHAAFSVCTTWGVITRFIPGSELEVEIHLLDVLRDKMTYSNLKRAVIAKYHRFRPAEILIEQAGSGIQLLQEFVKTALPVRACPPQRNKASRMETQTDLIEGGRVFLPATAAWLADYLDEMTKFPKGKYNDQVDSTSQALAFIKEIVKKSAMDLETQRLIDEMTGKKIWPLVRLKAPAGTNRWHPPKGEEVSTDNDGTMLVSAEYENSLLRDGWTRVEES